MTRWCASSIRRSSSQEIELTVLHEAPERRHDQATLGAPRVTMAASPFIHMESSNGP